MCPALGLEENPGDSATGNGLKRVTREGFLEEMKAVLPPSIRKMDLGKVEEECLGEETGHTKAPRPETTQQQQKSPSSSHKRGERREIRERSQSQRMIGSCI